MDKDAVSLLLYLETRAVDHGGAVDARHMNEEDFALARQWTEDGYLQFGRIRMASIQARRKKYGTATESHWVSLSDAAWADVARERRARAVRNFAKYYKPNLLAASHPQPGESAGEKGEDSE